jgi:hypothetical protein
MRRRIACLVAEYAILRPRADSVCLGMSIIRMYNGIRMAKRHPKHYVLCVSNEGYKASLEPRKIYVSLADAEAKKFRMIRVVDESGEDYLFPKDRFIPLALPRRVIDAISQENAQI